MAASPPNRCALCRARIFETEKQVLVKPTDTLPFLAHERCAEGPRCRRCGFAAHAVCPLRARPA